LTYYLGTLADRRHSTVRRARDISPDFPSKSLELESRISRLELLVQALLDDRQRRDIATQAQFDHLWARVKTGL
jgi:hypothetical protein